MSNIVECLNDGSLPIWSAEEDTTETISPVDSSILPGLLLIALVLVSLLGVAWIVDGLEGIFGMITFLTFALFLAAVGNIRDVIH